MLSYKLNINRFDLCEPVIASILTVNTAASLYLSPFLCPPCTEFSGVRVVFVGAFVYSNRQILRVNLRCWAVLSLPPARLPRPFSVCVLCAEKSKLPHVGQTRSSNCLKKSERTKQSGKKRTGKQTKKKKTNG